jgi:hypothetical protein
MNDPLEPGQDGRLDIENQIIDQLTIIRGCVELVLRRYPEDLFLKENLEGVISAVDQMTLLVQQDAGKTPIN